MPQAARQEALQREQEATDAEHEARENIRTEVARACWLALQIRPAAAFSDHASERRKALASQVQRLVRAHYGYMALPQLLAVPCLYCSAPSARTHVRCNEPPPVGSGIANGCVRARVSVCVRARACVCVHRARTNALNRRFLSRRSTAARPSCSEQLRRQWSNTTRISTDQAR